MIDNNYKYFTDNLKSLCVEYKDKFIVIKEEKVIGCYDTFDEAYNSTILTEEIGSFIIQLCSQDDENNVSYFYSNNVAFA